MTKQYDSQYYIKKGRRYVPVEPWYGFPADGIWVVSNAGKSSSLIMRLPKEPLTAETLAQKAEIGKVIIEAVCETLLEQHAGGRSIQDVATIVAERTVAKLPKSIPF